MALIQRKLLFISQKKILVQICFKARFYTSAELFFELNVINGFDYYNVELLTFSNQFVVFYQLNILTSYFSTMCLMFKPGNAQLNILCQLNPTLLVVIHCVTEVQG